MFFHALQWPVWDSLLDYGRLEWEWILMDLEKAPDVAYEDGLKII